MSNTLHQFIQNSQNADRQVVIGLLGSAKSFVLSQTFQHHQQTIIYVAPTMLQATQMYEDFQTFLPNTPIYLYPTEDSVIAELAISSPELMAQRIETIDALLNDTPSIVVMSLAGLKHTLSPKNVFQSHRITFQLNDTYNLNTLIEQLHTMGYTRVSMVEAPGQFSVRGGILDVYDIVSDSAYRIEFFDDGIDSIRTFNPETQKSLQNCDTAKILPASDVLFERCGIDEALKNVQLTVETALSSMTNETIKNNTALFFEHIVQKLSHGEPIENLKWYTDLYYTKTATVLDYITDNAVIVLDEYARLMELDNAQREEDSHWHMHQVEQSVLLPNQQLRYDFKTQLAKTKKRIWYFSHISRGLGRLKINDTYNFTHRSIPQFFSQMPLIKTEFERYDKQSMRVVVVVENSARQEKISQTFTDFGISHVVSTLQTLVDQTVNIVVGNIYSGFELVFEKIVFLNERELFNKVTKIVNKRQNLTNAERLKSYSELTIGDYVVHVSHGVGRYQGMETLDIGGVKQDYMTIVYEEDAKLFIPVTQIHLVQKYVASDGKNPKLNKLGGSEWAKTKKKVAKKIEDIADELIALYAQRDAAVGFAFSKDGNEQKQFEDAFSYAETPDQLRSVTEIKKDMESDKPMDRLLVGDVGYGKTEVAMRAIFKAVNDNKQVAFLVPTTILAQQHYMTLMQRFEDFPVNIGLLSRFKTKKEQEVTIDGLKKGTVDIVVGTHRVVSNDITFSDLGLIVIDEEQRFGVKHKEKLKQLKNEVDVLTLTATPIPRTLHMSMLGVRDLSVIETPPANRYPVQTYVMEQNDEVVRDSIERELSRGGQVFYLHNRVETIQEKAQQLQQLVPDARVAFAHGQMSEVALENILMAFMAGDYDVLVTTTIIETGVDLPNVNTLFIEEADRMGLSQLYQLRGRVGRTNRIAYAYFMYKPDKSLTETGEQRLSAMKEFTQLGAGFKIAMRDLSIRGAGNLLGKQQSGFIDSVGFDLYTEMLKEAVAFKKTGVVKKEHHVEIDLGVSAYIPNDYVNDERQKIDLYKRIRTIKSVDDYRNIQDDFIDRFGDYPDEVADLMTIGLIKHYASQQYIDKIKRVANKVFLTYSIEKSRTFVGKAVFEQLAKTKLQASIQTTNQQTVVVLDVKDLPTYLWLEEIQKYLA